MNGKYIYFALTALLGVLSSLSLFLPFFLLTCLYIYVLSKYKKYTNPHMAIVFMVYLIFLVIGQQAEKVNKTIIPESTTAFLLEYTEDKKIDGDLLQVVATEKSFHEKLLIRYKISSEQEKETLKKNDFFRYLCHVTGELSKPSMAKNPNGFDYRNYLATKQIYWIVEIENNPLHTCSPRKLSPLVMIKQIRSTGINYLENHFPREIASLSAALIFGDRNLISPDLLADYQKTGIIHLLAISGLHVSLLVGMVFYIGIRSGFTRQFMINFLLLLLPIYVVLTGAAPSVIRAVLMILLVLLTQKWKGKIKLLPIDAISLALIVYLLVSPMVIFDIGFKLSFTVSLAIVLSAPYILKRYQKNLTRMITTSVIAQLAALPLLLYHYFEISLISIVANLLYIPLFSFVFLPGLYLLFFAQLLLGKMPVFVTQFFITIIHFSNNLIAYLATIPFAHFVPGRPNWFFLIMYVVIVLIIFFIWEGSHLKKKSLLISITCFLFTIQVSWNFLNPFGEVTMIDVGQGDSILIHLPFGKGNYLIDTGGTVGFNEEQWRKRSKPYEVGRDVVVPYLKGKGITKIDKLILTHGDMDHIGGAYSIIQELQVKQVLMPSVVEPSETEVQLVEEAKKRGIMVNKVSTGDKWESGDALFYVLSPEKNFKGERNRGSIALFAKIGGVTWFLAGDLDQEGEEKVIKEFPHLSIDVLKAGHHGSKTSSSENFINQVKPSVALISVGEKNRFGHPHQEVLEKLRKANSTIYRTDKQGAITYQFYQGKGTFSSYLP
jgi:competence protein ComEC